MDDANDSSVRDQFNLDRFRFSATDAEKRLDFADAYAHAGLKSLFLLNGASIVSLLTFIGNKGVNVDKSIIYWSFGWFCAGLMSIILAYLGAYFSQNFYMLVSQAEAWNARLEIIQSKDRKDGGKNRCIGNFWLCFSIAFAFFSFLFFVLGAFVALAAIT